MEFDKIITLTFAKGNFISSQNELKEHLTNLGVKNQINLTDVDLPQEFQNKYSEILSHKKGFGYCIWKPFIILNQLKKMKEDEILFYFDSADIPSKLFFEFALERLKEEDFVFLNQGYNHGQWTKRDAFVLMGCDDEEFHNHIQLEAGVIVMKPTKFNIDLIEEWFHYCGNKNILTFEQNICGLPNINNFIEHRYDQSILTNLTIKRKIKSFYLTRDYVDYNKNQPHIY